MFVVGKGKEKLGKSVRRKGNISLVHAMLKCLCIEVSILLLEFLDPNIVQVADDYLGALKLLEGSGNQDTHDFPELSLNL